MSFEQAATQSVKANRALQKRESLLFDRQRRGNIGEPAIRAARQFSTNGKPYRLVTETGNERLYPILGIVSLIIALGIVLASVWSNTPG